MENTHLTWRNFCSDRLIAELRYQMLHSTLDSLEKLMPIAGKGLAFKEWIEAGQANGLLTMEEFEVVMTAICF